MQRVLIVGYGSIGQRHLKIVRERLPDASIMVFRHQATADLPEMANLVTSSINDIYSFQPEAAIIANPAPFHMQFAKELIDMGCHLLIEKPISDKSDDVVDLLQRVRAAGVVCQVGYNLRYLPSLSQFRNFINENLVGQPLSIRCEVGQYLPSWRSDNDYRHGVSARSDLGGGVMLELSHEIDYLCWIFGEVDWVSSWFGHVSDLDIDVEDTAHLNLGFKSKEFNKPVIANLNMDFIRRDATRNCTVIGSNGSLHWNGLTGVINIYRPGNNNWGEYLTMPHQRDDSYRTQWEHFLTSIANSKTSLVGIKASIMVLKIVEAAKASAQKNGIQEKIHMNNAFYV